MAGKMLVERTIFLPGRDRADVPLQRRSGRGKSGGRIGGDRGEVAGSAGRILHEKVMRQAGRRPLSPDRGCKP